MSSLTTEVRGHLRFGKEVVKKAQRKTQRLLEEVVFLYKGGVQNPPALGARKRRNGILFDCKRPGESCLRIRGLGCLSSEEASGRVLQVEFLSRCVSMAVLTAYPLSTSLPC